jgi:HAE1 family hydrophobic/amphiphilic exporter-1
MDTSNKPDALTKIALFFLNKWRITVLLLVGILAIGTAAYTTFLKREGFPTIEVPVALIQTPYFVNDKGLVDKDVTGPIKSAIGSIQEIKAITSTSTDNFSNITVEFKEGTTSKAGAKLLEDAVNGATLPKDTKPSFVTINAASFDGENDLVFSLISNGKSTQELQDKANFVAKEIDAVNSVIRTNVIDLQEVQTNPITGESNLEQIKFGRSAHRNADNKLVFTDAILIGAVRDTNVGTIEFSQAIQDKVQKLKDSGDLDGYDVIFGGGDASNSLKAQLSLLQESAISGLLAVMIIMILIVNWRASIVIAVFIPVSIALTSLGLYLIGYSLNTLTLFGLILVIGLIADDAILVIDAIDNARKAGHRGKQAVIKAINTVGLADISGTVTTILAFIPIALVSGTLGEFIKLIPITVILTLALSLIVSLTLIPFFANLVLPHYEAETGVKVKRKGISKALYNVLYFVPGIIDWINIKVYQYTNWYLNNIWRSTIIFVLTIALIGGGIFTASKLKFAIFAPAKDTNEITVTSILKDNRDLQKSIDTTKEIEKIIKDTNADYIDDITYFNADASGVLMYITLTPLGEREKTSATMVAEINDKIADNVKLKDLKVKAGISGAGPPTDDYQITFQVFSDDQKTLENSTKEIRDFTQDIKLDGGEIKDVIINNIDTITRKDGRRYASVQVAVSDPENTNLVLEAQTAIKEKFDTDEFRAKYDLAKDGVAFDLGQQGENLDSFQSAIFALIAAIIIMYILLVLQFNSLSQPFLILMAVPFSFPGLFFGLYLTNNPLSFFALIGITGLVGIVVNNTILLLDYSNTVLAETGSIRESISGAIKYRFRALITTSLSTIVGILPLAFADPFWEGLAYALVFGLASSTLLVIFAYPVFYVALAHTRRFVWRKIFRKKDFN